MARADDFLNLLATYLEANGVTSVFTGVQPASPDICTSLLGLPGTTISAARDVPGLQFPRFQAIVRGSDYEDVSTQHQLVRTLLHGKVGLILPVGVNVATTPYIRVMRCFAEQDGGPIGDDEQGRYEFSINFSAEFHYVDI